MEKTSRTRATVALLGAITVTAMLAAGCGSSASGTGTGTGTATGSTAPAPPTGPSAQLTGPVTGGTIVEPLTGLPQDLAANGYVEQEYFASGTATAFHATSMPSDGRWTVAPTSMAPYKTRIIVRRPADPSAFNGTVVVEWFNVSSGESAPDWDYLNPLLMRDGYAYVGVSAQALGVQGGAPILGTIDTQASTGLVGTEPARYGTLHHPGDEYAYDIFAQIGNALRAPAPAALGGFRPKRVVAVGESQSAFYLTTFADAIQPQTHTFDGIFIHSRGGTGATLAGTSITAQQGPQDLRIRTDLSIPVFMFETQTDMIELGYAKAQQPNTDRIRTWEVAGTSHADAYLVGAAVSLLGCTTPINTGPQHDVVQAAFASFSKWVDGGAAPPSPAPFDLVTPEPATLLLDTHGNVLGGVRTPAVDVPVSTLSGAAPPGASTLCGLFGSTKPFPPETLVTLYHSKARYLSAFLASLHRTIAAGYLLAADASTLTAQAQQVQFPS